MNIEYIGIAASVVVLLSFLYKDEKHIRLVNIVGAILFVVYGIFIHSISVAFLNAVLIVIHLLRLRNASGGTKV